MFWYPAQKYLLRRLLQTALSQTKRSIVEEEFFVQKELYAVATSVAIPMSLTARGSAAFRMVQLNAAILFVRRVKNAAAPENVCRKVGDNGDRRYWR